MALQAHEICEVGAYRTFQNLALWKGLTVLENVMVGAHTTTSAGYWRSMFKINTKKEESDLREKAYRCSPNSTLKMLRSTLLMVFRSVR